MSHPKTHLIKTLALALLLTALGFVFGRSCGTGAVGESGSASVSDHAPASVAWTCSMHPQVRLLEPGACPICGMDLIPANVGADDAGLGPRALRMSPAAMALAEIETAPVERRSVAHEVHMVGKVALDETRVSYITSWVSGRLDRMFVDYTGVTVRAGDHLVEIYSPTLYSAQQELLQAIGTADRLEGSELEVVRQTGNQMVDSAREKLRLYGLADEQIQAIVDQGSPDELITIRAPTGGVVVHKNALEGMYVDEGTRIYTIADLAKVWVLLDAYESDLAWLRYGQDVEFNLDAYPGETFHGRVAFIDPLLDDRTRTVKVRLNVANSDGRMKPEMFVSATAKARLTPHGKAIDEDLAGKWICPMHPEVVADRGEACSECGMDLVPAAELGFVPGSEEGESLVIPDTAPLVTGKRAVVYVRLPDPEQPTFEGREVRLGPRAGHWYVVSDGLEEGEQVVVRGNFKIDSELQIRARPSMMSLGEERSGIDRPLRSTPRAFREQLGSVLEAYLDLQRALSMDEDDASAARALGNALNATDSGLLDIQGRDAWLQMHADLRTATEALVAAVDMEGRRMLLAPLTERLVRALTTFGHEGDPGAGPLGLFHCPMASDGAGANWLQLGNQTANPYFGSRMLRCGSRVRVLGEED